MYPIRQKVYMPCALLLKNNSEWISFRKANLFVPKKVILVVYQNIVEQEDDNRY